MTEFIPIAELAALLMTEIRTINARLDELKTAIKNNQFKDDYLLEKHQRVERLTDTKFKLIYSLMDIKTRLNNEWGSDLKFEYKNIKE